MGSINWGRVFLGGLAAGFLINVSETILNTVVLEAPFSAAMDEMGKTMNMDGGAIAVWMLWGFAVGITTVWLYAAIRPRYGAGLKTALCAGATVWFLAGFLSSAAMVNMGLFSVGLMATGTVWGLAEMLTAAAVGGWLYKEEGAAAEA